MNRADHPRVRIDQQDRPAVGRGDADGETFGARDDGVGARPGRALPWSGRHHGIGRMDLEGAEQALRRDAHLFRHPAAIFRDIGGTGPCTRAPRSSAARVSAWKSTWAVMSASPGFFNGSAKLWRAIA